MLSAGSNILFLLGVFGVFSLSAPVLELKMRRLRISTLDSEEHAKLVYLKQRGWVWQDIQRYFLGRSTGSLQVRYSTKLEERNTAL
jgi:hypothetical protein